MPSNGTPWKPIGTHGSEKPINGRCCSIIRGSNPHRYCTRYPLKGFKRCRTHNSGSRSGPTHNRWDTGRYSSVLKQNLLDLYQARMQDPQMLRLDSEIGLVDVMLHGLLEKLYADTDETLPTRDLWIELQREYRAFKAARGRGNVQSMTEIMDRIGTLIDQGASKAALRDEALDLVDTRRKLVESETKRQESAKYSIPADQVMALIVASAAIVDELFDDVRAKAAYLRRIRPMLGGGLDPSRLNVATTIADKPRGSTTEGVIIDAN